MKLNWNWHISPKCCIFNNLAFSDGGEKCPNHLCSWFRGFFFYPLGFRTQTLNFALWSKLFTGHPPIPSEVTSKYFLISHYALTHVEHTCGFFAMSLVAHTESEKPLSSFRTWQYSSMIPTAAHFTNKSPLHRWERESEDHWTPWASPMCHN